MKITKLGHCCLYIEVGGVHLLTDPGVFSEAQNVVSPVDIILITHEHADHIHVPSLVLILQNNPQTTVVTNSAVGALLTAAGIQHTTLEGTATCSLLGIKICAYDSRHAEIYEDIGQVQNTGYLIAGRLYYPGDSFHEPHCPVDVLALPVAGPWCTVAAAIHYALAVRPKTAFPVHDGMIEPERVGVFHATPKVALEAAGIAFVALKASESATF